MIIDSHCHAWAAWPYGPQVPDPDSRGRVEQLLHEMDLNGVDRALVVSAQIDHNRDNNLFIKASGFSYASESTWDFPFSDVRRIVRALYEHFGPDRLLWGSDYPVVRGRMTYRQSIEAVRSHCDFVPPADRTSILGPSLERLLAYLR